VFLQVVTGLAYFAVSIVGFYAFGTSVADNVLLSFKNGPYSWVVAMAGGFRVSREAQIPLGFRACLG
jgi:hypothetical protein